MDEDILALMEAMTMQTSDTDPATAAATAAAPLGVAPPVQTPLEDSKSTASLGVTVGQKSVGQKENDELGKMSVFSLCLSAEAGGPCPDVVVSEGTSSAASGEGNVGKKNSRKRRNRKQSKTVYVPWPLMLQTRASLAAPVLGQTSVTGALPIADMGVSVGQDSRMQGQNGDDKKTSVVSQSWETPAGTPPPAASPVQPSLKGASPVASGQTKVGKKSRRKRKNKKDKKTVAGPWPLTVQAWASFTGPAPVQISFAEASPATNDGVKVEHKSRDQQDKEDQVSTFTLCQSTQLDVPCAPAAAPGQASLEEASSTANSGGNVRKKSRRRRRKRKAKSKSVLACPWPLTVQAWASFTAADPAQTLFQGESPAVSTEVNVGLESWPRLEKSEEETKSIFPWSLRAWASAPLSATAPLEASFEGASFLENIRSPLNEAIRGPERGHEAQLQSSIERGLEFCQGWSKTETYSEDQDFWECTVMNFARQVDYCYCREHCSEERMEAMTLTKAHTHISTSATGMQEIQRETTETQTVWMGKWEGF